MCNLDWRMAKVTVKARARENKVVLESVDEHLGRIELSVMTVRLPEDGAANASVLSLIAEYFSIPKTSLKLVKGHRACVKWIERNG